MTYLLFIFNENAENQFPSSMPRSPVTTQHATLNLKRHSKLGIRRARSIHSSGTLSRAPTIHKTLLKQHPDLSKN